MDGLRATLSRRAIRFPTAAFALRFFRYALCTSQPTKVCQVTLVAWRNWFECGNGRTR